MTTAGERLRARLDEQFARRDLEPDGRECELIDRAVFVAGLIEQLEASIAQTGPVTSDGKVAPTVQELRQQDTLLIRLLGQLDLGADEEGEESTTTATARGRQAANARWRKHPIKAVK